MRVKAFVSFILITVLALIFGVHAQQSSMAPSPAWNDNSLISVQKQGGDPTRTGDVNLEFYGHDAFKITSPAGLTVLTDPWRNDSTGLYPKWFLNEFPSIRVDLVLSTHAHFDHDAVDRPSGLVVLERLVGQFRLGDIEVVGLADKHKCESTPDHDRTAPRQPVWRLVPQITSSSSITRFRSLRPGDCESPSGVTIAQHPIPLWIII